MHYHIKKYSINIGVIYGQKDFTFNEAEALLQYLGYFRCDKGKTSGSRVMFASVGHENILLHRPHPQKELKAYQIKQLLNKLEQEGLV